MNRNSEYLNLQETKVHSDAYFPYNTYICSIPLDFTRVPPHWHDDVEIIVVKSGRGIVNVDTKSYQVKKGELIIVRPGQIHAIYQEEKCTMEYENIIFQTKLLYSSASDLCTLRFFKSYFDLKYDLPVHVNRNSKNNGELYDCIEKIDNFCRDTPVNYQMIVKSYLYQFFYIFAQNQETLVVADKNKNLNKMKSIISYVEQHYREDISIEEVSTAIGCSSSHFMKMFKKNMHTTFTTYLNDYRLNKAAHLLLNTEDSIVNIMGEVGFNNLSYFNRLFKEYFRMTPREFRK